MNGGRGSKAEAGHDRPVQPGQRGLGRGGFSIKDKPGVAISGRFTAAINASGATNWTMSRTVTTVFQTSGTPLLRAVTFTVTWTKTGNTATASTLSGSALDKLAFMRDSPISRTYTRIGTAFYGSQGINQTAQRL